MRMIILAVSLACSGCAVSNTDSVPTGQPGMAAGGAGPQIGASAGASLGGGPLGAGTDDNRAGAK